MSARGTKIWTGTCVVVTVVALAATLLAWPSMATTRDRAGGEGGEGALTGGLQVESLIGQVEVRQKDGSWKKLETGDVLGEGAVLRTGAFSRGMFRAKDGSKLAVKPNSTVTVAADDESKSRFVIAEGRVAADIPRQESKAYEFSAATGDARAETQGGRFQVVASREGLLGVATESGKVDLVAKGERVTVAAGKQAVALPDAAPSNPVAIPAQVFLRVKWPEGETTEDAVVLTGMTGQGSTLRIGGQTVEVGPDGSFERTLPLKKGENHFSVIAEDLSGRIERVDSPTVVRKDEPQKALKLKVSTEGNIWE
ncbi:MAG: FecR domain-containing protein [Deltaproteobacteria bacterium]|nr:FecR domain-containing protein [Deltaproteobacteria bacterium]